jgi:drug/metabolite transporter (DMT)-like permease
MADAPFPMAGELASLSAALIWSCSISLFTLFAKDVPARALNLYKNLLALVCLAVAAAVIRPELPPDGGPFLILGLSGILGLSLGDTALFAALRRLGAQVTSASQCLAPPISAVAAVLMLGESLTARESLGLTVTTGAVAAIIYFGKREGRSWRIYLARP